MTAQERDFWAALEADPADATTRLAFADYLDETGDGRGPGMRALAARLWRPYQPDGNPPGEESTVGTYCVDGNDHSDIPDAWFDAVLRVVAIRPYVHETERGRWISFGSDAETWDAVLRAFASLAPDERAAALNLEPAGVPQP